MVQLGSSVSNPGQDDIRDIDVDTEHYARVKGNYGLAEENYRKAVELGPRDLDAWLGLAASYDRLKRFDLADRAYAQARGRNPGGDIFIHGQPNGFPARVPGDWTDGCIALSNNEMEEMWEAVPNGTVIDIYP